ncbi:MAG: thioredoxin [Bacteroidales bacterium]|mgnify:CR=1 FL=1|nr:thioredoxin [Bacteroidales bacterium]
MAKQISEETFEQDVLKAELPVMVDFGATWCGPCKMIAPYMEQLSEEYAGKALVFKADVDDCPGLAGKFGIRNVPTVLYFKGGQVVDKNVGGAAKTVFEDKLKKLI